MITPRKSWKKGAWTKPIQGPCFLVGRNGRVIFHQARGHTRHENGKPVAESTCFDLASLTKPLATALGVMDLVRREILCPDDPVKRWMGLFSCDEKAEITISDLLCHTAGFPAWRPLYRQLAQIPFHLRRPALDRILAKTPLKAPPGSRMIYSDLGYLVLQRVVESASGMKLDAYVKERLFVPLGIESRLFFLDPQNPPEPRDDFAATENCPRRKRVLQAEVHDLNAWAMGGTAGHAGLFGTALGIWEILDHLMAAYFNESRTRLFPPPLVRRFLSPCQKGNRTFGFDTPSKTGSAAGGHFSSPSVGHLGFTGVSFWMDLEKRVTVIFLTNRVHPSSRDTRIREIRPRIHDAVMENLPNS